MADVGLCSGGSRQRRVGESELAAVGSWSPESEHRTSVCVAGGRSTLSSDRVSKGCNFSILCGHSDHLLPRSLVEDELREAPFEARM
jgi:hypothetical protein